MTEICNRAFHDLCHFLSQAFYYQFESINRKFIFCTYNI